MIILLYKFGNVGSLLYMIEAFSTTIPWEISSYILVTHFEGMLGTNSQIRQKYNFTTYKKRSLAR
jgi:hypothetical protein